MEAARHNACGAGQGNPTATSTDPPRRTRASGRRQDQLPERRPAAGDIRKSLTCGRGHVDLRPQRRRRGFGAPLVVTPVCSSDCKRMGSDPMQIQGSRTCAVRRRSCSHPWRRLRPVPCPYVCPSAWRGSRCLSLLDGPAGDYHAAEQSAAASPRARDLLLDRIIEPQRALVAERQHCGSGEAVDH